MCQVHCRTKSRMTPDFKQIPDLSRHSGCFSFVRPNKLIPLHGDGDFELMGFFRRRGLHAAQHFTQTANSHRRICSGECYQVFDAPADLNVCWGQKTHAARTDIPRLLGPVDTLIAQLKNLQRKFEFVPLSTPLFQDLYSINIPALNQSVMVPSSDFVNSNDSVGVASFFAAHCVLHAQLDRTSPADCPEAD